MRPPAPGLDSEAALTAAWRAHTPALMRAARAVLGDAALAEDAVQETWIKAIRARDSFRGEASLRSWLMRILLNTARDMLRARGREMSFDLETPRVPPRAFTAAGRWAQPPAQWDEITPERVLAGRQAWQIARAAIDALPEGARLVLTLHEGEAMSPAEIAQATGLSPANVRQLLHRGREQVRAALDAALARETDTSS